MMTREGRYDEALTRFHRTGPEFAGWLSNHGPMVIEAMARRGAEDGIHHWTDGYLRRTNDRPRGRFPIQAHAWRDPLGDPSRTGDWLDFFERCVTEDDWSVLVATWWPRLLPGIAAGATHGVIRVGHALRAVRAAPTAPRILEVAHALAYWAARWQPVQGVVATGSAPPRQVIATIPAVAEQRDGIRARLRSLADTPEFQPAATELARPQTSAEVPGALAELVGAAVDTYPHVAHGNPTMLVHAATAPNAVAAALPSVPTHWWLASFDAAWTATAAVVAAYRPAQVRPVAPPTTSDAGETWARALAHGGEHVVKFADTVLGVHDGENLMRLQAVDVAVELDA